jgi:hypothetical protein
MTLGRTESFGDDMQRTSMHHWENASFLNSMTNSLEIAFECAVFQNRFEIDEQEPHSRLQALTELLLQKVSQDEEVTCKAATISIISEVSRRVRELIECQTDASEPGQNER